MTEEVAGLLCLYSVVEQKEENGWSAYRDLIWILDLLFFSTSQLGFQ